MRQKRSQKALNSIDAAWQRERRRKHEKEVAAWRRKWQRERKKEDAARLREYEKAREKFNGRLAWEDRLDAPSNWPEYCKCVAKRLVSMSIQAIYRSQKSRQGRTDKNNPQPAIRIPRHYVPTRVVLCPRQSAKRRRTG